MPSETTQYCPHCEGYHVPPCVHAPHGLKPDSLIESQSGSKLTASPPVEPGEPDMRDYRNAPSGAGPLADQWRDKPHRLVYDLCNLVESLTASLSTVRRERDEERERADEYLRAIQAADRTVTAAESRALAAEQRIGAIRDAAREVERVAGCGDHGCYFKKPTGMGTNGSCRCGTRGLIMGKVAALYRAALATLSPSAETPTEDGPKQ